MSYLIDTCCISELVKKKPNPNVVKWFADRDELSIYLSVITFGELRKGIEKLPDSKKKKELNRWVKEDLKHRFKNRILNITIEEVNKLFLDAAKKEKYKNILVTSQDPIVSSDIIANPASTIIDLEFTRVVDGDLVKIMTWYDNEWGYSSRLFELCEEII
jgi:predicted nucleic acid-binding protein